MTVGWTDNGQQIRKYIGTFRTREEAINALANYNQNPYDVDLRKLTFAEIWQQWCRQKYKDAPVKSVYVAAYKNLSALHELIFSKIRKRHIQFAPDMEIVTTNYASPVELPTKTESEIHKPFSLEELITLWEHKEDAGAKVALILCYTGLRPTELAQIKTADVDLPGRVMKGGIKTAAGKNRLIPIAEKIFPLIKSFHNPAHEYLLTLNGKPLLTVQNLRLQIWNRSELLTNHLPHDGRHTCATLMDNADVPKKIQQLILGHSSQDVTSKVYTHKTLAQLIEAINRI